MSHLPSKTMSQLYSKSEILLLAYWVFLGCIWTVGECFVTSLMFNNFPRLLKNVSSSFIKQCRDISSLPSVSGSFQLLIGMNQSEIDESYCRAECFISELYWLAEGLGHMSVLISGSHPFTFLCLSSLPSCWHACLLILNDDSPKCFNRNVLITGGVSYLASIPLHLFSRSGTDGENLPICPSAL